MIVLVVEDEPHIRALCREVLVGQGHEVHAVAEGATALGVLATRHIDVLLLDYRMPGIDGAEVLHRARVARPDLPAVVMTGLRVPLERFESPGVATRILPKPFTPAELVHAMSGVVAATP